MYNGILATAANGNAFYCSILMAVSVESVITIMFHDNRTKYIVIAFVSPCPIPIW